MATITNVSLRLQRTGSPAPSSPRTATVAFTTRFSLGEMQSGALFTADVKLRAIAEDGSFETTSLNIGTATVQATSILVEKTMTVTFTRSTLDEDRDSVIWYDQLGHPHILPLEREDEWRARVVLTPVIQTITRNSAIVRGSWGRDGNN